MALEHFARARSKRSGRRIKDGYLQLDQAFVADIASPTSHPRYEDPAGDAERAQTRAGDGPRHSRRGIRIRFPHKVPGYAIVTLSLKPPGKPPGDATSGQMDAIADLADEHSASDEIRVDACAEPRAAACQPAGPARALAQARCDRRWRRRTSDLVTDIIACPGLDYCSLANARSIPDRHGDRDALRTDRQGAARHRRGCNIKISGCINACGHHHVGHIGILGVEKNGKEFYQITLGGKADEDARLGQLLGPAIPHEKVADTIERVVNRYLELRLHEGELFIDTVKRLGVAPFKETLHAVH